jgi:transcriptional regulator with XRE-family HTH domain
VTAQQEPTDFNHRVAANVQRLRKAADKSQAQLAHELALRDLPFQQQIIANVEKGIRPLKFDEAVAIAEILGVPVIALGSYSAENPEIAAAVAQLNSATADRSMRRRQIAELEEQIRQDEERMRDARRRLEELEESDAMEAGGYHRWIEFGDALVPDDIPNADG